jgi:hypothetical protein
LVVQKLLPPDYQPHYRQWDWYRAGKDSPSGKWTRPYVDASADRAAMVTFATPIHRDGRFVGVVTADLAMDYFRNMQVSMDRLELGPNNYVIVLDQDHRVLAHEQDRYEFPRPESDLEAVPLGQEIRTLLSQTGDHPSATTYFDAPSPDQKVALSFSRVNSSAWVVVTVHHIPVANP